MFLKYPSERKRQKKKKEHSLFRRIWWSINRIWEPWGHFIPHSHEELPMATAQKEPWKHHSIPPACPVHKQRTFEVTVIVPSLHRAEIHLYATTVRPLTFKSMDRKRSDVKLSLSWDMTYSSLLATDTVGFPCAILQDSRSAAHLTAVTFF